MTNEEQISKAINEGFDLDDLLGGVKMATQEVKIFFDAETSRKAVELNAKIDRMRNQEVLSIVDVGPEADIEKLKALRADMDKSAVTFVVRAISSKEDLTIKRVVADENKIPNNADSEQRKVYEKENEQVYFEHKLAVSCLSVTTADEKTNQGVTVDDARKIRASIPLVEWQRLCIAMLEADGQSAVVEQVIKDPAFFWCDTEPGA